MKASFPLGRYCLRLLSQKHPASLRTIRGLRRLCYGADPLVAPYRKRLDGRGLRNPFLAQMFALTELGTWSLSPATLNYLEGEIRIRKPRVFLEFGSGISTVCLARYMSELHGEQEMRIISIEQDVESVLSTSELLHRAGLSRLARVFHAPVRRENNGRGDMTCYTMGENITEVIAQSKPDAVLIDGPAAEDGARYATLPRVLRYLAPGARFYLDDALRDGELWIAQRWAKTPGIHVDGFRLTEKGLLTGYVAR